jgi:hypothetical protein
VVAGSRGFENSGPLTVGGEESQGGLVALHAGCTCGGKLVFHGRGRPHSAQVVAYGNTLWVHALQQASLMILVLPL